MDLSDFLNHAFLKTSMKNSPASPKRTKQKILYLLVEHECEDEIK